MSDSLTGRALTVGKKFRGRFLAKFTFNLNSDFVVIGTNSVVCSVQYYEEMTKIKAMFIFQIVISHQFILFLIFWRKQCFYLFKNNLVFCFLNETNFHFYLKNQNFGIKEMIKSKQSKNMVLLELGMIILIQTTILLSYKKSLVFVVSS